MVLSQLSQRYTITARSEQNKYYRRQMSKTFHFVINKNQLFLLHCEKPLNMLQGLTKIKKKYRELKHIFSLRKGNYIFLKLS
jgi:hypothetical protein